MRDWCEIGESACFTSWVLALPPWNGVVIFRNVCSHASGALAGHIIQFQSGYVLFMLALSVSADSYAAQKFFSLASQCVQYAQNISRRRLLHVQLLLYVYTCRRCLRALCVTILIEGYLFHFSSGLNILKSCLICK